MSPIGPTEYPPLPPHPPSGTVLWQSAPEEAPRRRVVFTTDRGAPQILVEKAHADSVGGEAWLIADSYDQFHSSFHAFLGLWDALRNPSRMDDSIELSRTLRLRDAAKAYSKSMCRSVIEAEAARKDLCAAAILTYTPSGHPWSTAPTPEEAASIARAMEPRDPCPAFERGADTGQCLLERYHDGPHRYAAANAPRPPQTLPERLRAKIDGWMGSIDRFAAQMAGGKVPVAVTGIWLRTLSGRLEVLAELDGKWRVAIDAGAWQYESEVSHIVEPAGIRSAPEDKL